MLFVITVTATHDELEPEDREVPGAYVVTADDEEAALDYFHDHIAIGTLEHFDIDKKVVETNEDIPASARWI